jgi:GNAT superfamily N-acetyltransferase
MATQPTSRWRKVREHLRWRGPFIAALVIFRELLRPLVYWDLWHIYETNISKQAPEPYAKEEWATKICGIEEDADSLTTMIVSMGELAGGEVTSRLARGHLAAVAFSDEQPVGYMWLAVSCLPEEIFDTSWVIRPGEAVRYNSFVIPAYRGRGVHSVLNAAANCYARQLGIATTLAAVSALNPQSMSLPKHYRRAIKMTVLFAKVRGTKWTIRRSFGAPLESRFRWPIQEKN